MTEQFKSQFLARCQDAAAVGSHIGLRELLAWVADIAKQVGLGIDKDAVKVVVLQAYDTYVAPVDLPYIPNLIEPSVDAALRKALDAGIDKIFEALAA